MKNLLQSLHGKVIGDAWRRFAAEHGGEYESRSLLDPGSVTIPWGDSVIRLGLGSSRGTSSGARIRMCSPVINPRGLSFKVLPWPLWTPLVRLLGYRRARTGDEAFDKLMVVDCDRPESMWILFDDPELRLLVLEHEAPIIMSLDDGKKSGSNLGLPSGTDVLTSMRIKFTGELDELNALFRIHTSILDRLRLLE